MFITWFLTKCSGVHGLVRLLGGKKFEYARFEVLTGVIMNTFVFWDVPFPKIYWRKSAPWRSHCVNASLLGSDVTVSKSGRSQKLDIEEPKPNMRKPGKKERNILRHICSR